MQYLQHLIPLHLGLFNHIIIPCVPPSGIKVEIFVNIDAGTLKFGMKPPCMQSLRFRKNQLGGPCEDYLLVIKGQSFGHLKDKRGLQDKPCAPEGYLNSLLPTNPIISSAFALWANVELYILLPSPTNLLSVSLPVVESWKCLSILMLRL